MILMQLLSVLCAILTQVLTAKIFPPRLSSRKAYDSCFFSTFDAMEAGVEIQDIGLTVYVGKSIAAPGRGLFVSINEEGEVFLPRGTPVCGYSRGKFTDQADGDKTVAFLLTNVRLGVIYEKELMPLYKAIGKLELKDLTHALVGHILEYDQAIGEILCIPDESFRDRYFIPDENLENQWRPGSIGIYANDLAYDANLTKTQEVYEQESKRKNILQLVWRVEKNEQGQLTPTWPVVVTKDDVLLTNAKFPLEVGIQYSWRYWEAVRALFPL